MVEVSDAPYSGMCSPGMIDDSALGRYVLFFCNVSYDMADTADATFSNGTCSFTAAIVIMGSCCVRVSSRGENTANRDKRTIAVIAVAKVRKNSFGF